MEMFQSGKLVLHHQLKKKKKKLLQKNKKLLENECLWIPEEILDERINKLTGKPELLVKWEGTAKPSWTDDIESFDPADVEWFRKEKADKINV